MQEDQRVRALLVGAQQRHSDEEKERQRVPLRGCQVWGQVGSGRRHAGGASFL